MNKKGFTLIEVVVALGILATVFAGTVTLVVSVVNLELSSRQLTEAVAVAQGIMANKVADASCGCTPDLSVIDVPRTSTSDGKFTYQVSHAWPYNFNKLTAADANNFVNITVYIEWTEKGKKIGKHEINQVVRIK